MLGITLVAIIGSPVVIPATAAWDLLRLRPQLPTLRTYLFVCQYVSNDTIEILAAGLLWILAGAGTTLHRPASQQRHQRLQAWSIRLLARRAEQLLGIRVATGPGVDAALTPGNAIVICRHVSLFDASLPSVLYQRLGVHTRGVIMAELLADPGFDLLYQRAGSVFIPRDNEPGATTLAASIGAELDAGTVAVIFPDGRLFRPDVLARALARLSERDPDRARRLAGLRHLLPPRPGGLNALLDAAPDADVVVVNHAGLDHHPTLASVARDAPFARPDPRHGAAHRPRRHPRRQRGAHRVARRAVAPDGRLDRRSTPVSRPRVSRSTWNAYIRRFHTERPGITEAVLGRTRHEDHTPYAWLTESISPDTSVIDLACGSAPTRRFLGPKWVGVDASTRELAQPARSGPRVAGDLAHLPFRDATFDDAVCSMALMVIDPLPTALAEIRRILGPGAEVRILLPAKGPLSVIDRYRYMRLAGALGTSRLFPTTPLDDSAAACLDDAGLTLLRDERARFGYRIASADDAHLLIDSLYLPQSSEQNVAAAHRLAARWIGHEIGIPLRRIIAVASS
jgi:SAM-dependent methyltransferase